MKRLKMANLNKNWAKHTVGSRKNGKELAAQLDGYHSPKIAVDYLIEFLEKKNLIDDSTTIWEPANGFNRISNVFEKQGYKVFRTDIHMWSPKTQRKIDFLTISKKRVKFKSKAIITNPPFKLARQFALKGLQLANEGELVCLLLRTQFLESNIRYTELFSKHPPIYVCPFSFRLPRMHRFGHKGKQGGSVLAFAWFIFRKDNTKAPKIAWFHK
jgi:hypothetical protein